MYYDSAPESEDNLALMRLIDRQYTKRPFYGSRRIVEWLRREGHAVNRKRVQRLLRVMGLQPPIRSGICRLRAAATRCIRTCSEGRRWSG